MDEDYNEDMEYEGAGSHQTTRSTSPAGSTATSERKVRKNHNEFERKRREQQRVRLEELRLAVPGLDAKASMVAILTAAREYIDELRSRIDDPNSLANIKGTGSSATRRGVPQIVLPREQQPLPPPVYPMAYPGQAPLQQQQGYHLPNQPRPMHLQSALPPLVRKISSDTEESVEAMAFRKGRAEVVDRLSPVMAGLDSELALYAPSTTGSKAPQRTPSPLGAAHAPLKPTAAFPNQARPSLMAAAIQESFYLPSQQRRDSGLLLPTDTPDTFYYGHRDSMQTLMAVPLPHILDRASGAYVACSKCARGVEGLVMIDCDTCRKWSHIRCVGIDATSIPVKWSCPECQVPERHF